MAYIHLSIVERERIQKLLWEKKSIRYIACVLKRSPSSISREIRKNNPKQKKRYTPRLAHERAITKRSRRGEPKLVKDTELYQYVVYHLKLGWSPEQIALVRGDISHEAIYQHVYRQIYRGGHGQLRPEGEDLRPYLPRRRKRRMAKGFRVPRRVLKGELPSIDERPIITSVGHWEDDSIVNTPTSSIRLRTTNELCSGIVFIDKVRARTMVAANQVTIARLARLPKRYRKTLTRDRGSENLGYQELEQVLGIKCYFAHPYHSWERGANENLNGLIRRYLPKGTDFNTISDEQIKQIEYLLNSRPRKRLGGKTPYQVFYELTGVALQH
jgi:transposase, IS30 family